MGDRSRERAGVLLADAASFVGRDRELEKISILLLGPARLITLTGPGGIGKTRLAAEAVRRFQKAMSTPVYWARLARLAKGSGRAAIEEEIARSVVEVDFSERSARDLLVDTFTGTDARGRNPQAVLVLDNCEHVLTGVGQLTAELLEAVPGLTILATSREAIGWIDEYQIVVPSLTREQALALFRQRAELTGHPVTGTDQTATAAMICQHVDNHPLYIRLAAARLVYQPLAMILQGLSGRADDTRLRWSPGPGVGGDPRHRRVTDVIAWSYELCTGKERQLFGRMSVFAAGYDTHSADNGAVLEVGADLEAIENVCADDELARHGSEGESLSSEEIQGLLNRLIDRSLVTAHITPTTVRYSLLESLQIFAQQRLCQRSTGGVDEPSRLAGRHRRYYRDKVAHAAATCVSPAEQDLMDWARASWDNILVAIDTSITTPGEAAVGLEICAGLLALRVPFVKGSFREMRRWTERCLQASRALTPQPTQLQVETVGWLVWLSLIMSEGAVAEQMLEDCVAACLPDPHARADWRNTAQTDIGLPAPVELAWGTELLFAHSDVRAITVLNRAREKFHRLGNGAGEAMSDMFAATAASLLGTRQQAYEFARGNLDRARASGAGWLISWAELVWTITLTKHGNPTEALAVQRRILAYQLSIRDQFSSVYPVRFRTWSLAQLITDSLTAENPDRDALVALATEIARLAGGSRTQRGRLGMPIEEMGPFADESAKAVAVARRILGPDVFAAEEARGTRLRPELGELQRLALGTLSLHTPSDKATGSLWRQLTGAEQLVAVLAAAGWTNPAIAARRGKSTRTIDTQIAAVLQKLAITSREDIIGHIPKALIDQVRTETTRRPRGPTKS
ncbi:ATP-binding protein [Nocardia sp. CY41]|uniref:ATP-binding protein n=1 Tax=Nocardia sp. CY41 TaxID=2608686 RepID=UPI001358E5BA|nr:AAA family ATPase [Nocardia sp. CY41]